MKVLSANLLGKWRYLAVEDDSIQRIIATEESPSIYFVMRDDKTFKPELLTIWGVGDTAEEALKRAEYSFDRINDTKTLNNK